MTISATLKNIALTAVALISTAIVTPILVMRSWNRGALLYCANERGDKIIGSNKSTGKITIQQALALSEPYLQESLEQIRRRQGTRYATVKTYVLLKDKWYYVFKDDYPWKAPVLEVPGRYENFSIRVNVDTGEVIH